MFKDLSVKQKISLFSIIIVLSGVIGWVYEVIFYYFNGGMKEVYFRGGNFLPFINIYVYGALLIIFFTRKHLKHPLKVFFICAISSGLLEYFSGLILYGILGWNKGWDYNNEILNFGNIQGYVCLRSVLVFGILGLSLMYMILPIVLKIVKSKYINVIFYVSVTICAVFLFDEIYNLIITKIFDLPSAIEIYKSLGVKYM